MLIAGRSFGVGLVHRRVMELGALRILILGSVGARTRMVLLLLAARAARKRVNYSYVGINLDTGNWEGR